MNSNNVPSESLAISEVSSGQVGRHFFTVGSVNAPESDDDL